MPLLPQPTLSTKLTQAIERAEAMHGFAIQSLPDTFTDENEDSLVAAFYSITEEHHAAILYLLRAGQFDGSAFTLARPLVDAAYRAHWLYACAKPEIVERIRKGENCYPGLINMANAIEKKLSTGGIFTSIAPYINSLHEFTHGGMEQLLRRFDAAGNVRPSYSDADKVRLINASTAHFVALTIAWCQLSTGLDVDALCAREISKKYSELYGR